MEAGQSQPSLEELLGALLVLPPGHPQENFLREIEYQDQNGAFGRAWAIRWVFRDNNRMRVASLHARTGEYMGDKGGSL